MAFADRRFSPVLVGVERPKADVADVDKEVDQDRKQEHAKSPVPTDGMTSSDATGMTGCNKEQSSSSSSWLKRDGMVPSGQVHTREQVGEPKSKAARFSIHEVAQCFTIGDDSESEADEWRDSKDDRREELAQSISVVDGAGIGKSAKPTRYRVRTKDKSWRLFCRRKG